MNGRRKRPPFPKLPSGTARIYLGKRAVRGKHGRQKLDRKGDPLWKPEYGWRKVVGVATPDGPIAWQFSKLQELWKALPWHGTIEWSYEPERDRLVVCWRAPERRGHLKLYKATIAEVRYA